MKTILRKIAHGIYGFWFVAVFAACAVLALLSVLLIPTLSLRQRFVRRFTQCIFWLTGTGPVVNGLMHLPDGPCMLVGNHASYLDGPVMTAVLPPRFSFLIKAEMNAVPLAGFLLRRIDSFFVDRSKASKSATSARQIIRAARAGRALGVFPEGTFDDTPGLKQFQKGAFAVAKAGSMPIVPFVISGTRHILPASSVWPKPGRIHVTLFAPVAVDDVLNHDVVTLRDQVRHTIIEHLDEPDLLADDDNDAQQKNQPLKTNNAA
ncbi:MAG: lysophospholipid acyltransferase family protein [Pseudomonadota bacterium]